MKRRRPNWRKGKRKQRQRKQESLQRRRLRRLSPQRRRRNDGARFICPRTVKTDPGNNPDPRTRSSSSGNSCYKSGGLLKPYMKKVMLVAMIVLVAAFAMAQNPTYTAGNGITGVDKLGAHQNGGRGCVGCHAPHSGAAGAGGNAITGQTIDTTNAGNGYLWGQDLGPLYGYTLTQGDKFTGGATYTTVLPAAAQFSSMPEEISDIMTCLSCHDGNIAKGAMMTNKSYEQAAGLLPTGLYGPNAIPTLLGNDGTTAGNYYNDHPVGPQATLGAVGVAANFTYTVGGCTWHGVASDCLKIAGTATNYQAFANHYGAPNII